ncbi:MAG: helix-turn-helix domain-containing protein [Prevotella sp.]|nr:helix-turn-helix domain-containing protein [Prevotella sp.]
MKISADQLHLLPLSVGRCHRDGGWQRKNVYSPFSRLGYVAHGEARVTMPRGTYTLKPGHLYLIPPFTMHCVEALSPFSFSYIHFCEEQQGDSDLFDEWDFPLTVKAGATDVELIERTGQINPVHNNTEPLYDISDGTPSDDTEEAWQYTLSDRVETRGIVLILLSRFLKQAMPKVSVQDERIYHTLAFIRKNMGQPLGIDELADRACMSKDHFIRVFKREMGMTPNVFITKRKLERAELMLLTTDQAVKTIATALGFGDSSYFNRLFKKNAGVTPQQYRERKNFGCKL